MSKLPSQLDLPHPDLVHLAEKNRVRNGFLQILRQCPQLTAVGECLYHDLCAHEVIYPPKHHLFQALCFQDITHIRVVIIGQDPYHQKHQAHGLAFSVPQNILPPPSLTNIITELNADLNTSKSYEFNSIFIPTTSPDLTPWARRGVLLLNTILTVKEGRPGSHKHIGWQQLTSQIITQLSEQGRPIVFMLWGRHAYTLKDAISHDSQHLILTSPHPSPLSAYRGFFGSRMFSQANQFLHHHPMA